MVVMLNGQNDEVVTNSLESKKLSFFSCRIEEALRRESIK